MANTIKIKSSTTAGNTPSLVAGELGVNIEDAKLWVGDGSNNVLLNPSASTSYLPLAGGTLTGNLTVGGYARSENITYAANQDVAYLIAGTSGWTGTTTNWNTFGFQHKIKTDSGGVPRVTIDRAGGEAFSVDNSSNAVIGNNLTVGGEATFAAQATRFTYSGAGVQLRSDNQFYFLADSSGSAQQARFKCIQVSDSYSGSPPTNGVLFGTDTQLYRSGVNTLSLGSGNLKGSGTLGTSGTRWSTIYGSAGNFSGNLTVSGSCTFAALSGTSGTFSSTMSLGSSQKLQWGDAATYITGSNSGDFLQFYPDGNVQLTLNSSGATIEDSLTVGGSLYLTDTNTRLHEGDNNSLRITTDSGYVDAGCQNTAFAHFYTDRNQFYFNKQLNCNGHVFSSSNNTHYSGLTTNRWSNVYSVNGDFSGTITATSGVAITGSSSFQGASFSSNVTVSGSAIIGGATTWAGQDSQTCAIYLNNTGRGLYGNFANHARNLVKANSQYVEVGQNSTLVHGVKFIVGSNAANGFMFQSNIGNAMTTHMNIRGDTGRVGIGTASPSAKLHAVSTQCDILAESTTANQATRLRLKTTSHEYRLGTQGASDNFWIYDVDAADYRFVLDPNGRCGIGETSPEGLLSFKADESNTPKIRFQNQHSVTTDAAISTYDDSSGTTVLVGSNLYIASNGATTRFNTDEQSSGFRADRGGLLQFYTGEAGAAASERLRIDSVGNITHVSGSPEYHFGTDSTDHCNWRIACQEAVDQGFEIASGTTSAGSNAASDTYTTRFVVKGSGTHAGNVSVGSTSSVYGRLFVDATSSPNGAAALAVRGRSADASYIAVNVLNNLDGSLFNILNDGKATFAGSVGVGSTPSAKLHVNGDSYFGSDMGIGMMATSTYRLSVSDTGNAPAQFLSTSNNINLTIGNTTQTQYTNILMNSSSGNAQIWKAGGSYTDYGGASSLNIYCSNGKIAFHSGANKNKLVMQSDGDVDIAERLGVGGAHSGSYGLYVHGTSYFSQRISAGDDIDFQTMGNYITFFGDSSRDHAITSRNSGGNASDDLRINTYGALFINLDSNINNSSGADFSIGRHGGTGAISDWLLDLSGETGQLKLNKYGGSGFTGTVAKYLAVDDSGNVIQTDGTSSGSGTVTETHADGTDHELAVHVTASNTIGEAHKLWYNSTSGGLAINTDEGPTTAPLYVNGMIRADSFYEKSSSTYYFKPTDTGTSLKAAGKIEGAEFRGEYYQLDGASAPSAISSVGQLYAYDNTYAALYYMDGGGTSHALHSASDYRLKENIADYDLASAVSLVKSTKVKTFDFKVGKFPAELEKNRVGFMAHELQEAGCLFGGVVSGTKDETLANGNDKIQSVNYGNLVPVIWAALQNALKRIEELEAK